MMRGSLHPLPHRSLRVSLGVGLADESACFCAAVAVFHFTHPCSFASKSRIYTPLSSLSFARLMTKL